jgi:glycosyltransferase involved in cell wall biosynthesis
MIIGIDANKATLQQKTGIEWYTYHLLESLLKLQTKHNFILYSKYPLIDNQFSFGKNIQNRVLRWPLKRAWYQIRFSSEMFLREPDVLFIPSHTIPLIHAQNTVTTCHDVGFARFPELYSNFELKYHLYSMRFALKAARKIITISNFSKQEILEMFPRVNADKIKVIYLSYDEKNYKKINNRDSIAEVLAYYNLNLQIPFMICIGRLEKKKNTLNLLKAFKILKQSSEYGIPHKLFFAGGVGTGFRTIQNYFKKLPQDIQNDIIMPGWIEEKHIPYLLNAADVFVFPSFYEGFGIPLLEAFACETPVAASRAGSIPEIAQNAALLFDPYSPEDMASSIYDILVNKKISCEKKDISKAETLRNFLIIQGKERLKHFSWHKCAKKTLDSLTEFQ